MKGQFPKVPPVLTLVPQGVEAIGDEKGSSPRGDTDILRKLSTQKMAKRGDQEGRVDRRALDRLVRLVEKGQEGAFTQLLEAAKENPDAVLELHHLAFFDRKVLFDLM